MLAFIPPHQKSRTTVTHCGSNFSDFYTTPEYTINAICGNRHLIPKISMTHRFSIQSNQIHIFYGQSLYLHLQTNSFKIGTEFLSSDALEDDSFQSHSLHSSITSSRRSSHESSSLPSRGMNNQSLKMNPSILPSPSLV